VKTLSAYVTTRYPLLSGAPPAIGFTRVAYKASADIASKGVTLVVTVAAARTLAAADFGVMALAMTSGWLLGVASDAGLPMHLATRVAHAHAAGLATAPILRDAMRWRGWLALAAAAAGVAIGMLLLPAAAWAAFTLFVLHQLFGAVLDTVAHAYRGLGRTDIEATISFAHRGTILLGALTLLALQPSLLGLAIVMVIPSALALLVTSWVAAAVTRAGVTPRASGVAPRALDTRRFTREVMPIGLGVLLSALYFRCDVYFLQRLHGVEVVGAYNAAFRLVDALRLLPAAALAVVYPMLCRATDYGALRSLSTSLFAASVVVSAVIFAGADALLTMVYGPGFAAAGDALRVLSLCVPFFYVNYALTHQVIAWDRHCSYLAIAVTALAVNLIGNGLLIPAGSMAGAAWSTLLTEMVVCGGCLAALKRR
jgi:O-antigen/teichoic acid export membrane protein